MAIILWNELRSQSMSPGEIVRVRSDNQSRQQLTQRCLNPRVTQPDLMFALQLLVKMFHVEVVVLLLIQAQYFLHPDLSNAIGTRFGERFPTTPIKQPVIPSFLPALLHSSHLPTADAQDLGRLIPL